MKKLLLTPVFTLIASKSTTQNRIWHGVKVIPLFLMLAALFISQPLAAKKYPFDMEHSYSVQQIRVAQDQSRFLKVFAVAGNADKAITQALQDAVACCIFQGLPAAESTTGHNATAVPALCPGGVNDYQAHKEYFDRFFTEGDFLQYVENSNTRYPSGENNLKVKGGRRVGVYVQLKVKQLRQRLEQDGIIKSLDNIWDGGQ